MTRKLVYRIAELATAIRNCRKAGNAEWEAKHTEKLEALMREYMPSGSGFDNGTELDLDRSGGDRVTFTTAFHHMDDSGGYCGWTDHTVTVRPHFIGGLAVKVSGRDYRKIKDYIAEVFAETLAREIDD